MTIIWGGLPSGGYKYTGTPTGDRDISIIFVVGPVNSFCPRQQKNLYC